MRVTQIHYKEKSSCSVTQKNPLFSLLKQSFSKRNSFVSGKCLFFIKAFFSGKKKKKWKFIWIKFLAGRHFSGFFSSSSFASTLGLPGTMTKLLANATPSQKSAGNASKFSIYTKVSRTCSRKPDQDLASLLATRFMYISVTTCYGNASAPPHHHLLLLNTTWLLTRLNWFLASCEGCLGRTTGCVSGLCCWECWRSQSYHWWCWI